MNSYLFSTNQKGIGEISRTLVAFVTGVDLATEKHDHGIARAGCMQQRGARHGEWSDDRVTRRQHHLPFACVNHAQVWCRRIHSVPKQKRYVCVCVCVCDPGADLFRNRSGRRRCSPRRQSRPPRAARWHPSRYNSRRTLRHRGPSSDPQAAVQHVGKGCQEQLILFLLLVSARVLI